MGSGTEVINSAGYLPGTDEVVFEWHPLWWHKQGLMQTASGYGSKLNTGFKIRFNGRLYRVYCCQWSNSGTAYIISKGDRLVIPNHRVFIQIGGQTS
jgi:hypothetical protein